MADKLFMAVVETQNFASLPINGGDKNDAITLKLLHNNKEGYNVGEVFQTNCCIWELFNPNICSTFAIQNQKRINEI